MSAFRSESYILSLFDSVDALAEYCMADNAQKNVIIEKLLAKLHEEGKALPAMECSIKRMR